MTASGLGRSDLGKNLFYSALNLPYPNGKIIAVERVQTVYWLVVGQLLRSCHKTRQRPSVLAPGNMSAHL